MCQIIIKPKGLLTNMENLDTAQARNKDGNGVMWFNEAEKKTYYYKTLDYDKFKNIIETQVSTHSAVIHLRLASKGSVTLDNVHPFKTSKGSLLCHNGTLTSWGTGTLSDSKEFAKTFASLNIDWNNPATTTLVKHIIGTAYNKIVVMTPKGKVIIFNKELFVEEEGILYSNLTHHKPKEVAPYYSYKTPSRCYYNEDIDDDYTAKKKYKVFVYGTLKEGYSNNFYLIGAKFLGKAATQSTWAMVGKTLPYPYLLGRSDKGHYVKGEVYEITEDIKRDLDALEGVPKHYMESRITVKYDGLNVFESVITYTKTTTTVRPSLINDVSPTLFIEEWVPNKAKGA